MILGARRKNFKGLPGPIFQYPRALLKQQEIDIRTPLEVDRADMKITFNRDINWNFTPHLLDIKNQSDLECKYY